VRCDFAFPVSQSPNRSGASPPSDPWKWDQLVIDFIAAGYSEDLFWSLTPRQIIAHFQAARKRFRTQRNMMMETSYWASVAPHQKKLIKLETLLLPVDEKPRQQQTPEQRLATAAAWAAAMGRR
jgi:hypothetical protein